MAEALKITNRLKMCQSKGGIGNGGVKMKRVADKKCDTSLVFIDLPYACQVALPDRLKSIDQNQRLMIYVVCLPGG
jgi:hypothetical protein